MPTWATENAPAKQRKSQWHGNGVLERLMESVELEHTGFFCKFCTKYLAICMWRYRRWDSERRAESRKKLGKGIQHKIFSWWLTGTEKLYRILRKDLCWRKSATTPVYMRDEKLRVSSSMLGWKEMRTDGYFWEVLSSRVSEQPEFERGAGHQSEVLAMRYVKSVETESAG